MESKRKRDFNGNNVNDEEVIFLQNCKSGLGIKICGGQLKDGSFAGIYVKRIMIGGVAAKEGSLREGDQLLQVNDESLASVTSEEAICLLRREAYKGQVRLVFSRSLEARLRFEDLFAQEGGITSSSPSYWQPKGPCGNSVLSRNSSVSSRGSLESPHLIRKRSWVYNNGRMSPSPGHYGSLPDLQVDGEGNSRRLESFNDSMLTKTLVGTTGGSAVSQKLRSSLFAEHRSPSLSTVDSGLPSTSPYPSPGNSENDMASSNQVQTISVVAERGLGISIYGGSNQAQGPSVYIDQVIPGCDADLDGRLQSGDLLVSINKESLTGVTYEQARAILMRLKVRKGSSPYTVSFIRNPKEPITIHHPQQQEGLQNSTKVLTENLNRTTDPRDQGLLEELSRMLGSLRTVQNSTSAVRERDLAPNVTLGASRSSWTGGEDRTENLSNSMPSLSMRSPQHPTHGRFSPDLFSTPHLHQGLPIMERSIQHCLMQDIGDVGDSMQQIRATGGKRKSRNRRLSLDPKTRMRVEKLEEALDYLGYNLDEDQRSRLKLMLRPDGDRTIAYGEFVSAAREVLGLSSSSYTTPSSLNAINLHLAVRDLERVGSRQQSQIKEVEVEEEKPGISQANMSLRSRDELSRLTRERDEVLREVQYLREKLKEKDRSCTQLENDLERIRQETHLARKETTELRNRVQLANEAQRAARLTEQENDLLIEKLEKEIASMRTAGAAPSQVEFNELQKRLVVLGCQLRKAEVSKRTYEVAVEKLTRFAETVHDSLAEEGRGTLGSRRGSKSGQRQKQLSADLAQEARETVKAVKLLLEEEPLPFGWEEVYAPDGTRYYINHVTQTTSWVHPVSGVQHLPTIKEDETPADKRL